MNGITNPNLKIQNFQNSKIFGKIISAQNQARDDEIAKLD
jgi:hypothetical protein